MFLTRLTSPKHILTYMCNGQLSSLAINDIYNPCGKQVRDVEAKYLPRNGKTACVFLFLAVLLVPPAESKSGVIWTIS